MACQDHQAEKTAVKRLSQGHNEMARVGVEPKSSLSQSRRSNHSITLPTIASSINSVQFRIKFRLLYRRKTQPRK